MLPAHILSALKGEFTATNTITPTEKEKPVKAQQIAELSNKYSGKILELPEIETHDAGIGENIIWED